MNYIKIQNLDFSYDSKQKSDKLLLNNAGGYSDGVLINYIKD